MLDIEIMVIIACYYYYVIIFWVYEQLPLPSPVIFVNLEMLDLTKQIQIQLVGKKNKVRSKCQRFE